jgi:hypothetical protein
LHATEELISNTFTESIDKVSDQVDKAFIAIKQLVDKSVENLDNKAGQVQQEIGKEKSKLFEKFNKKFQAIEQHFKKFKGSVKRMEFDDDEEEIENLEDVFDEARSIIRPNTIEKNENEGKNLQSINMEAELRSDIKSSISDAIVATQEKFNKLVDDQVGKINKKIADVGDKLDSAISKLYSTVEKLKVIPSKVVKPDIVAPSKIELKEPKLTTPIPIISSTLYEKLTTPEYYKFTVPSIKYRKEETSIDDSIKSTVMSDIKEEKKINENSENDDIPQNVAESTSVDGLIDAEVQRRADKSEITSDNGKSVDDLQSEIIENVKDALKSDVNTGIEEEIEKFSIDDENNNDDSVQIIPNINEDDNGADDNDKDEEDEGKKASVE